MDFLYFSTYIKNYIKLHKIYMIPAKSSFSLPQKWLFVEPKAAFRHAKSNFSMHKK